MSKEKKAVESKFAQESAAESTTGAATGPSEAMIALFKQPAGLDLSRAERLNMPQMILPKVMPVGAVLSGEVVKVVDSPASNVDGYCLWISIPTETGTEERLFPVNGYVRKALAPDAKKDSPELKKTLEGYKGKTLAFKRMENRFSKQFGRDTFPFDVFVLK